MPKVTQLHLGLGPGHVCSKPHPGTGQPHAHEEQRFSLKFPWMRSLHSPGVGAGGLPRSLLLPQAVPRAAEEASGTRGNRLW